MKLIKSKPLINEPTLENIKFKIHKFNNRTKPTHRRKCLILCCFSEFGCETVGIMYALPKIIQRNIGKYIIVIGWHGRQYLYKHLVDEFWEIDESYQWLREYCRASHHKSNNLFKLEEKLVNFGKVITSAGIGQELISAQCNTCNNIIPTQKYLQICPFCSNNDISQSIYGDIKNWKKNAIKLPKPSKNKIEKSKLYIKDNTVGVVARGRKCYGRNLPIEYYTNLIYLLFKMGYNVIWLGEKQTTQRCPVPGVLDFANMPESQDLELTLAIISQLKFTIQYWTASTRLAGMIGVPYLLFESPDQIIMKQEGIRRSLCDLGPSKLVYANFIDMYENLDHCLEITYNAISQMQNNDFRSLLFFDKNKYSDNETLPWKQILF